MPVRRLPDSLRALGRKSPPADIQLADGEYRLLRTFKHDFFAATSLYDGPGGRVIVKIGRRADFLGLPLGWVGRCLTSRECRLYERLSGVPGIPEFRGRIAPDAFAHRYIEGHALTRREHTPDPFFDQLTALVENLHALQIAYVDLEKPENVLVGDDGRPYLVDFQIAWFFPPQRGPERWPLAWLRRTLQAGDRYHLLKLRRRCRPDQLTPQQRAALDRKPWPIRLHRRLTEPFQRLRRSTLKRVDPSRSAGERGLTTAGELLAHSPTERGSESASSSR